MKRLALVLVVALTSAASAAESSEFQANIRKGNFVGGSSFSFSTLTGRKLGQNYSTLEASLGTRYFLIDRLAIGPEFSYNKTSDEFATALLGPAIQYYFWAQGQMATYLRVDYLIGLNSQTVAGRLHLEVGFDYFIIPSVSVGPYLAFNRTIEKQGGETYTYLAGGAGFSFFF